MKKKLRKFGEARALDLSSESPPSQSPPDKAQQDFLEEEPQDLLTRQ
jgi:hypothetical protein